jgi:hypothetical protein
MTPEQALNLLDQLAARAPVDRVAHMQALQAAKIIKEALEKKPQVDKTSADVQN